MIPTDKTIKKYVQTYIHILQKKSLVVSHLTPNKLFKQIKLAYMIDEEYDTTLRNSSEKIENLYSLIRQSDISNSLLQREIDIFRRSHEAKIIKGYMNYRQYLLTTSENIGTSILSSTIANENGISEVIWFSKPINKLKLIINTIMRISNDMLDYDIDFDRKSKEVNQVKSIDFIQNKQTLKIFLLYYILIYYINKGYYSIYFRFRGDAQTLKAIDIADSPIRLGIDTYFRNKDSGWKVPHG